MLEHVTFTGWDRHTDLDELREFLEDCPQDTVEIAVLYSDLQDDADRYPEIDRAQEILRTAKAAGQRSAVHLCGQPARTPLNCLAHERAVGEQIQVVIPAKPLIKLADRVQVNVTEDAWPGEGPQRYRAAADLAVLLGRPVIVPTSAWEWPDTEAIGPGMGRMVPFLFAGSTDAGQDQTYPDPPEGRLVGYSGSLSPGTVGPLARQLSELRYHARCWFELEAGVREKFPAGPRRLDEPRVATYVSLTKCVQVMSAVGPFLRHNRRIPS